MELPIYQIDAFTDKIFSGNPAAVCPLHQWLPDALLQSIASENNLAETAFFVPAADGFHIRWFTPTTEVALCGHATLASAFVIFNLLGERRNEIFFESQSGKLSVSKNQYLLTLNFPSQPPRHCDPPKDLLAGLKKSPLEVAVSEDYLALYATEEDVINLDPNFEILKKLDRRGVIATAKGKEVDFVSRFFAPQVGINEDPVTGSAHCELTPFWSQRLGKTKLAARQVSRRGGQLECELSQDRVLISGKAAKYLEGKIFVDT
jgi:PhzF family phenazine biosynthesis protein